MQIRKRVKDNYILITNSFLIEHPVVMQAYLDELRDDYPNNKVLKNRSDKSMIREWIGHNNMFKLNLFKEHTRSVEFNWPIKWYEPIIWWILSIIKL